MINMVKLPTNKSSLFLRVAKGHFATSHSHINYYIDVTTQKARLSDFRKFGRERCKMPAAIGSCVDLPNVAAAADGGNHFVGVCAFPAGTVDFLRLVLPRNGSGIFVAFPNSAFQPYRRCGGLKEDIAPSFIKVSLDEIVEMAYDLQARLLRVLETGKLKGI